MMSNFAQLNGMWSQRGIVNRTAMVLGAPVPDAREGGGDRGQISGKETLMMSAKTAISSAFMLAFLAGAVPASAAPGEAPTIRPVTVATFAVDLVRASGVPEAGWKGETDRLIVRAGIENPGSPLTEGAAASLLRSMRLEVFSASPEGFVSRQRAVAFVRQAERLLLPTAPVALDNVSMTSTPGPGSLNDCIAASRNHGACVNCCKDLGIAAKACTRFCVSFTGKPSASEPIP